MFQEKQKDVYWVLQTVLRTTDRASEEGKLFSFVPDFYVDVCINTINALTSYFHPTVPYTSLPGTNIPPPFAKSKSLFWNW